MHVKSSSCRLYQTHHNRQRVRIIIGNELDFFQSEGWLAVPWAGTGQRAAGWGGVACLVGATVVV